MFFYGLDISCSQENEIKYCFHIHSLLHVISFKIDENKKMGGSIGFIINLVNKFKSKNKDSEKKDLEDKKAKEAKKAKKPKKEDDRTIFEKISDAWSKIKLVGENSWIFSYLMHWLMELIKKFHLKAQKGQLYIATGQPDYAGYLAAFTGLIEYNSNFNFDIDFNSEKAYCYGDGHFKGHFHITALLIHVLKLFLNKEFRGFLKEAKN